jgi:hypothetical protein
MEKPEEGIDNASKPSRGVREAWKNVAVEERKM